MAKIKTFELDRWSEPDEKRRVRHIGMADAKETFDRLQTHLELKGLLPDEYFLFSDELTGELPEFDQALCIPNFGASEGIYLDISLACRDKDGKRYFQNFATGKTLGETADDYRLREPEKNPVYDPGPGSGAFAFDCLYPVPHYQPLFRAVPMADWR